MAKVEFVIRDKRSLMHRIGAGHERVA